MRRGAKGWHALRKGRRPNLVIERPPYRGLLWGWSEKAGSSLRLDLSDSGFGDGTIRKRVKKRSRKILGTSYDSHALAFHGTAKLTPKPG